jgi:hypothetical protein
LQPFHVSAEFDQLLRSSVVKALFGAAAWSIWACLTQFRRALSVSPISAIWLMDLPDWVTMRMATDLTVRKIGFLF